MGRKGHVYRNSEKVGFIEEHEEGVYEFGYDEAYLQSNHPSPVSLTLPLQKEPFRREGLFPFFISLLSEGNLADIQCTLMRIDEMDSFGRLLKTATFDTIGSITVKEARE